MSFITQGNPGPHVAFSSYRSASFNLEVFLGLSLFFQGIDDFLVIFIYLAAMGLSCGIWNFKLQHVGSGSLKENRMYKRAPVRNWAVSLCCAFPRGISAAMLGTFPFHFPFQVWNAESLSVIL